MAIVVLPYDHTLARFWSGENRPDSVYTVNLYSAFTFNADAETKAQAEVGCTQIASGFGYLQNQKNLTGVVVNQSGSGALFDADDVTWTASSGNIVATHALLYNDSAINDPPVLAIDFGGSAAAPDGAPFQIVWNVAGIITVELALAP
jgi:hypothetical protein